MMELQRLNDQLSRSLEGWGDLSTLLSDAFTPLADVEETDDAYLVEIELPGVKKGDIEISMEGRRLTVSASARRRSARASCAVAPAALAGSTTRWCCRSGCPRTASGAQLVRSASASA